jgi:hypothetical protein
MSALTIATIDVDVFFSPPSATYSAVPLALMNALTRPLPLPVSSQRHSNGFCRKL